MRRLRTWWHDSHWLVIAVLWLVALVLGYAGFARTCALQGQVCSPGDILYLTLQLIPMNSGAATSPVPWPLATARLLVPALTLYTAVAAFALLFQQRVQLLRLRFLRDHLVICGAGHSGSRLLRGFRQRGDAAVVIDRDEDNRLLEQSRSLGAIVLTGDATSPEVLRQAGVHRARWLVAMCGDDGTNAELAVHARELVRGRQSPALTCVIQMMDPQLCGLLRDWEIAAEESPTFRLELFNLFDQGAHLLLQEFPPFGVAGQGPEATPWIIVVGLGNLGESLVVHATKTWRDRRARAADRLQVTVIDREAAQRCASLAVRYPQLPTVADVQPLEYDVRSAEFQCGTFLKDCQGVWGAIYVCLDDDALALQAGLTLLRCIESRRVPVVVRMAEEAGLAKLIQRDSSDREGFRNLHVFALLDRACTPDLVLGGIHEVLAQAIHAEYVREQERSGETRETNPSLVAWDRLPEFQKESNRRQVDHIGAKLKAVGCVIASQTDWDAPPLQFTPDEIQAMARLEHERWLEELQREGWHYAEGTKDPLRKAHPGLVPWDALPDAEKEKCRTAVRSLPDLLARAGFQIVRRS